MAVKSFKARAPLPGFDIDIEGADGTTLNVKCRPNIPGTVLLDAMAAMGDGEDYGAQATAVKELLTLCILNIDEFWEFCNDPAKNIDLETLSEIAGYLGEMYGGDRPLEPSAPSSAG